MEDAFCCIEDKSGKCISLKEAKTRMNYEESVILPILSKNTVRYFV